MANCTHRSTSWVSSSPMLNVNSSSEVPPTVRHWSYNLDPHSASFCGQFEPNLITMHCIRPSPRWFINCSRRQSLGGSMSGQYCNVSSQRRSNATVVASGWTKWMHIKTLAISTTIVRRSDFRTRSLSNGAPNCSQFVQDITIPNAYLSAMKPDNGRRMSAAVACAVVIMPTATVEKPI